MKEELLNKLNAYKEKLNSLGRYLWPCKKGRRNNKIRRRTNKRRFLAKCW